jgi:hypothetical protein
MRTPLQEKQALTDMLGRLNEDRFFARRAQAERRALRGSRAGDRQARADRSKRSLAVDLLRALGTGAGVLAGALLVLYLLTHG